jgi:hypothetical protein
MSLFKPNDDFLAAGLVRQKMCMVRSLATTFSSVSITLMLLPLEMRAVQGPLQEKKMRKKHLFYIFRFCFEFVFSRLKHSSVHSERETHFLMCCLSLFKFPFAVHSFQLTVFSVVT